MISLFQLLLWSLFIFENGHLVSPFWEWPQSRFTLRWKSALPCLIVGEIKRVRVARITTKKKLSFALLKYATSGEIEVTNKRGRVLIMPTITNVTNNSMNGCYKSDQMVSSNYSFNCKTRGGNECFPGVSKLVMPMHLCYMYYILWQRILKKPMHLLET